ncbi:restriction endonuclease subunit S [Prevotella sp.]|uniref:restriction endonuclease subunit S n=1 Tax=Prevotella sp. TaxID=59823 RepID=UPI004024F726
MLYFAIFCLFRRSFTLKARIGWQGLTKKEYLPDGEYKLITGTDFTTNNTIDFDHCVYVSKERYEQDPYIQIKEDDVLITKDGTLGKIAYISELPMPATLNGGVFVVRGKTGEVTQRFLKHYLISNNFKNWIEQNHTAGSIMHLTQKLLEKFNIPVPSPSTQEDIVSTLDAFEQYISKLERLITLREKQYAYYREKLLTFE